MNLESREKPAIRERRSGVKVKVLRKSIADGRNRLLPEIYDYPSGIGTVKELIQETVKICLHQYEERKNGQSERGSLEEQAASGKVVYGMYSQRKPPKEKDAVQNAWESFEDGTVAVFVDGKKMEALTEEAGLHEGSEVIFVKLAALSADCILLDWMH